MSTHLDLEEQEQIDQLKHFWKQYGNLITWLLIAVLGAYAAWNGYQYWQRTQSQKAAALYDEVDKAAQGGDVAMLERALGDMKDKFGGTTYAQQAALLSARVFAEKGKSDQAKGALQWVADKGDDAGYAVIARLRLAALLADAKSYDDALKALPTNAPKEFEGLVADRRGDILMLQGKTEDAKAAYQQAHKSMPEGSDFGRLVAVKLNALGVETKDDKAAPAAGAASGKAAG